MKHAIKSIITLLLTTLFIVSCSSTYSPYNDSDSQRSRSGQTQGEMSKDTK